MSNAEFKKILDDAGVPTSEEAITAEFKKSVVSAGSNINNESEYSPTWRFLSSAATKSAKALVDILIKNIMPQFFLKTVGESFINLWGDSYGVERKQAETLLGRVLFTRVDTSAELVIPAGTVVYTDSINNTIYELLTIDEVAIAAGADGAIVAVQAAKAGAAYNLETGYYRHCDIDGLTVHQTCTSYMLRTYHSK